MRAIADIQIIIIIIKIILFQVATTAAHHRRTAVTVFLDSKAIARHLVII